MEYMITDNISVMLKYCHAGSHLDEIDDPRPEADRTPNLDNDIDAATHVITLAFGYSYTL
ncbi:MAG: hypothetical protein SVR08_13845 [Spirochaetota bacterium]|nr:hypothetical protein [Spirochaetota bacterium]